MSTELQTVAPEPNNRWGSTDSGNLNEENSSRNQDEHSKGIDEFRNLGRDHLSSTNQQMYSAQPKANQFIKRPSSETKVSTVRWNQLRKISATLFPTSSPFGKPTAFVGSQSYIIVGSYSADILIFNYEQQLISQLSARGYTDSMLGVVTSLCVSSDESRLLAGFGLGAVAIWDISKPDSSRLLSLILPQTRAQTATKFEYDETHLTGVPVIQCGIIGDRQNWYFISVDASGSIFSHKLRRLLLEMHTKSRRILGKVWQNQEILCCRITENFLALITAEELLVAKFQIEHGILKPFSHWRILRSQDTAAFEKVKQGCLQIHGLKLVYSWNSNVKLLNLSSKTAESAYNLPFNVENLDFITSELLIALGKNELAILKLNSESKKIMEIETVGIGSSKVIDIRVLFRSVFVMGEHEFKVGKLANWADQLLFFLNNGRPCDAIELAYEFYKDEGDLSVLGLPFLPKQRRKVIIKSFPDLVITAMQFSTQFDEESLTSLMPVALKAAALICPGLLESIAEICEESTQAKELFLKEIKSLVLAKTITKLPPPIFKNLVSTYADPELFYNLDLSTLDLDLAFKLCSKYENAFYEIQVYLESQALHDYIAPLESANQKVDIYKYLSYTITGRAFPTGKYLNDQEADFAKQQTYSALFLRDSDPLYVALIERDPESFFQALHEGFEEPWLNENQEINRQIIVNFLLVNIDKKSYYFANFVAQNYPKYRQFLVLSDVALNQTIETLCLFPYSEQSELIQLSLIGLLSVYKPRDNSKLVQMLVSVKFITVLQHILRRQQKLLELAKYELNFESSGLWRTLAESFSQSFEPSLLFIQDNWEKLLSFEAISLGQLVVKQQIEFWELDVKFTENILFLISVFSEVALSGGKLPPRRLCSEYVCLLAQQNDLVNETHGDELMYTLNYVLTGPHDVELALVVDTLLEYNRVDALTLLLSRLNRKQEALIYIRNYIYEKDLDTDELDKYVDLACNISSEESEVGGAMWKQLIKTLNEKGLSHQIQKVIHRATNSNGGLILEIFEMLMHEKLEIEVASIISQIFTNLVRKEQELRRLHSIFQLDNLTELLELVKSRRQGWIIPVDGECEICGNKIVGLGINASKLYQVWENQHIKDTWKYSHTNLGQTEDLTDTDIDRLVLFQCNHSYHYTCLLKMSPKLDCIICQQNS